MSRNLGRTDCAECPGTSEHIVLEESPRAVSGSDIPPSWLPEYEGLIVAEARCVLCHTLYLAWVRFASGRARGTHWEAYEDRRFVDLSYRHAFNDEPAPEDLPVYEVERVVTYRRVPRVGHPYLEHARSEGVALYEARRATTIAEALTVGDEIERLGRAVDLATAMDRAQAKIGGPLDGKLHPGGARSVT